MEKKRSKGVTIFGILIFIFFLFWLWVFFKKEEFGRIERLLSLIMMITCPFASYGIFTLKKWAKILVICIASLIITFFGYGIISAIFASDESRAYFPLIFIMFSPFVIFGISCIYFFTRPKVKEQFKRSR